MFHRAVVCHLSVQMMDGTAMDWLPSITKDPRLADIIFSQAIGVISPFFAHFLCLVGLISWFIPCYVSSPSFHRLFLFLYLSLLFILPNIQIPLLSNCHHVSLIHSSPLICLFSIPLSIFITYLSCTLSPHTLLPASRFLSFSCILTSGIDLEQRHSDTHTHTFTQRQSVLLTNKAYLPLPFSQAGS